MSAKKTVVNDDSFVHFRADELGMPETYHLMVNAIAPRPIAFVSTISETGVSNLAPFSYFNTFGSNPPVIGFSSARRGRDGTTKDTYRNLSENKECVVQIVTFPIVEQMNVASTEYPAGTDEFVKSGLTKLSSHIVKPFRVLESPFQMECKLIQLIHLGGKGGSGILSICEVVKFHVNRDIYIDGKMQPLKIDQVARNGGAYYTRANASSMFEVQQPGFHLGVGYDQLPESFKNSHDLSANDLGQLSTVQKAPTFEEAQKFVSEERISKAKYMDSVKQYFRERKALEAWKTLLVYHDS